MEPATESTCKVSVIVPAYKPGRGIQRVITSLGRQTMPAGDFELIIIDDGSPDDTWTQLQKIRDGHDNVRIERIENSGWPSRPRNIGLGMAKGEYVLFMDHDDEIYPDGLQTAYDYASKHSADVLNPKENKTSDPRWGLKTHTADLPNALPERGIDALMPMMPHKLYRRQFLLDHDIRFPEGRRMLWEDVYFNVECYKHAEVVSMLSTTAVYLWHATDQNNSATYGPANDEFWDRLDDLFAFIATTLDDEELAAGRHKQLMHQYQTRVLQRVTKYLASPKRPTDRVDNAVSRALAIADRYIPEEWDADLSPLLRPYAWLLRRREVDQLRELLAIDNSFTGHTTATAFWWSRGTMHVQTNTRWSSPDGRPLTFLKIGDRILRDLPASFDNLPDELRDVTEVVPRASAKLGLRDVKSKTTWNLSTRSTVTLEPVKLADDSDEDGRITATVSASVAIDPSSAAQGKELATAKWRLTARQSLLGKVTSHAVHIGDCAPQAALLSGRGVVVHGDRARALWLDVGRSVASLMNSTRPDWKRSEVTMADTKFLRRMTIDAPLLGLRADEHVILQGEARVERHPRATRLRSRLLSRLATLRNTDPGSVRIVVDPDGARLQATIHRPARGAWRLRPVLEGKVPSKGWDLPESP